MTLVAKSALPNWQVENSTHWHANNEMKVKIHAFVQVKSHTSVKRPVPPRFVRRDQVTFRSDRALLEEFAEIRHTRETLYAKFMTNL